MICPHFRTCLAIILLLTLFTMSACISPVSEQIASIPVSAQTPTILPTGTPTSESEQELPTIDPIFSTPQPLPDEIFLAIIVGIELPAIAVVEEKTDLASLVNGRGIEISPSLEQLSPELRVSYIKDANPGISMTLEAGSMVVLPSFELRTASGLMDAQGYLTADAEIRHESVLLIIQSDVFPSDLAGYIGIDAELLQLHNPQLIITNNQPIQEGTIIKLPSSYPSTNGEDGP